MNRMRLNILAAVVALMGSAALATPAVAVEELAPVCCPGSGGNCCGDECKSSNDGSCSACTGWRCLLF